MIPTRDARVRQEDPGARRPAPGAGGDRGRDAASEEAPLLLPKFDYHLDESDPDIAVLRRQDGAFVAAFSARGATREGIVEAAEEDYRALLREHAGPLGLAGHREKVGA